jgi:hypothetical protein
VLAHLLRLDGGQILKALLSSRVFLALGVQDGQVALISSAHPSLRGVLHSEVLAEERDVATELLRDVLGEGLEALFRSIRAHARMDRLQQILGLLVGVDHRCPHRFPEGHHLVDRAAKVFAPLLSRGRSRRVLARIHLKRLLSKVVERPPYVVGQEWHARLAGGPLGW